MVWKRYAQRGQIALQKRQLSHTFPALACLIWSIIMNITTRSMRSLGKPAVNRSLQTVEKQLRGIARFVVDRLRYYQAFHALHQPFCEDTISHLKE